MPNASKQKRKPLKKDWMLSGIAIFLLSIGLSSGCARLQPIHPITDKDIYFSDKDGTKVVCFSDYYFKEVLKAKVEGK